MFPDCGLHGWRHREGMSLIQAYLWNRGSLANDDKGKAQVKPITRPKTDALQDGRLLRSSDEAPVMGVERRG
jgi:hypothetical protein